MISHENNPTTVQSLNELVTALTEGERTKYGNILRSIDFDRSDFEKACSWSQDSYTRNCITENDKFELILLCWEKGQVTPIHDHGGEECWVKIIEGKFRETIYKENEDGKMKVLKSTDSQSGDITYMIDFMGFHCLENLSDTRSMSLHLYAKPIKSCNIYNESSDEIVSKELMYDTVSEW